MGCREVIVLDTHVLIQDAITPEKLSSRARSTIESGFKGGTLACADISLWEIAMLIARGRIDPKRDAREFVDKLIDARRLRVLPINAEISVLAQSHALEHGDPADRLIAATAQSHSASLVTADKKLRQFKSLTTIW